jgi:hypothetical protein
MLILGLRYLTFALLRRQELCQLEFVFLKSIVLIFF